LIHWRTESRSILGGALIVAEGCAAELTQAIAAALAAANTPPSRPLLEAQTTERVLCLAPAFVEMAREPGLPRIWACAHLSALGPVSAERPWTHLQTAFIRAWPQRGTGAFRGELETLPFSALHPADTKRSPSRHLATWSANSLEEAFAAFQSLILIPRAAA
jgi:hypothetical protein